MDKDLELLRAKDAIFKMIMQFCHAVTDNVCIYFLQRRLGSMINNG